MNKKDFAARLLGSASIADFITHLIWALEQVEVLDPEGEQLTPTTLILDIEGMPQKPEAPYVRIQASLKYFHLQVNTTEIKIPTKAACEFLNGLSIAHEDLHEGLGYVIDNILNEIASDADKVLAETLRNNLLSRN